MSPLRRTVRTLSIVLTPFMVVATLLSSIGPARVGASSHREAPLISSDPDADGTDTYAFVSPDRPDSVTLIANFIPFEHPDGGPNYYHFADEVLYEIHVDNVGDAKSHITYQFEFNTTTRNANTFLYNVGPITAGTEANRYPNLNVIQTYTLREIVQLGDGVPVTKTLATNLEVPPVNVGPKSTPDYESLVAPAIHTIGTGESAVMAFAGQRDDPFWVDLGSVFDLLSLRGQPAPIGYTTGPRFGLDSVAGYNVHTLALQVPINRLTVGDETVIGVWSTASRHSTRVLNGVGGILSGIGAETHTGPQVQVSRLGMPLVNEVVIPRALKDAFNNLKPEQDAGIYTSPLAPGPLLKSSVLNPELQQLLELLYGVPNPGTNRKDLEAIFLTGLVTTEPFTIDTAGGPLTLPAGTNVNQPADVQPSEMIRLNTASLFRPGVAGSACSPTPDYQLGLLGGDACGFPNGRRLQDDVTDIELLAVAGAAYDVLTDDEANPFTFNSDLIDVLSDGVDDNDKAFLTAFPYVPTPHQGTNHRHDQANTSNLPMIFKSMEQR